MRYVSPFVHPDDPLPEWMRREQEAVPPEQFASGPATGFWENLSAGYAAARAGWLMRSRKAVISDVRRQREETIAELAGKPYDEVMQPYRQRVLAERVSAGKGFRLQGTQQQLWDVVDDEALKLLIAEHPQWRGKVPVTPEEVRLAAVDHALQVEAEAEDVVRRGGNTWSAWLGNLAGDMLANLTDPQNIASGFFGGGAGPLSSFLAKEAAIGAAGSAAALPWVASWREELGQPMTAGQMAAQVAADAVASAGIAAGVRGLGRLAEKMRGKRSDALLREQARAETEAEKAALEKAAAERHMLESNPLGDGPEEQAEHVARLAEAQRALEERRKPDIPDEPVAPPDATIPHAPPPGEAVAEQMYVFDPRELQVDARRFQFKEGGDEYGVTDRLAGVERWIPERAGQVMVWEDRNGVRWIVDGHQRMGLARRIMARDPAQRPRLIGTLLREADGITAEMARARAAAKNIAEGSGTALDAAKVLRDAPEVGVDLPPTSALVRDAQGLAQLADDAFMMVVNGKVEPNHAGIIGRLAADRPEVHASIMEVLAKHKPKSAIEAESMVRDALAAGQVREVQQTLFGEEASTRVLYAERAKLISWAVRNLRRDRQAFNTLVREQGRIEQAGNKLKREANAKRAEEDAILIETIQKLARRKGPVADELARAAERLARGEKLADVGGDFLEAVRRAAALGGENGRAGRAARRDTEGAVAGVEGGTKTQEGDGKRLIRLHELPPAQARKVARQFILEGREKLTLDALYAKAARWREELEAQGQQIARDLGIEFKSGGIKDRKRAAEKMKRKGYARAVQLTDIVRGGFVVRTPQQADAVVAALAKRYSLLDEGWGRTEAGYFDRKVLVRLDDGGIAEIQLWEQHVLAAKERQGHAIYREYRALPPDDPRRLELRQQMQALYSAAWREVDESWEMVLARSSRMSKASGNISQKSSSSMTAAVWKTSSASTSTQRGLSSSSTAQARSLGEPSSSRMAGRQSQLQNENFMGDTSTRNVDDIEAEINSLEAELRQAAEETDAELPLGDDADARRLDELLDEADDELRQAREAGGCLNEPKA